MDEVIVEVLGCGDAFASGGRFNTCFYIHSPSYGFLMDCGATSLLAMKQRQVNTNDIDLIVISHFHGDHFGGLPFFLLEAGVGGRTKPLVIVSPEGGEQKVREALSLLYPGSLDVLDNFPIEYVVYEAGKPLTVGPLELQAFPVVHSEDTLPHGLRLRFQDKLIGFSGDTSWTKELVAIAEGADLFLCECNSYDLDLKGHLNYHTLLANRPRFSCKQIMLTHFGEEMLRNAEKIAMDSAWDGRKLVL